MLIFSNSFGEGKVFELLDEVLTEQPALRVQRFGERLLERVAIRYCLYHSILPPSPAL